jgi:hypothetical protein
MKVKYVGDYSLRFNGIDWQPGDEKDVSGSLKFDTPLFKVKQKKEQVKTKKESTKKKTKSKKSK